MAWQAAVICRERGTETDRYNVCYEDGGRIVQGTVICTERGTVTELYLVCCEDGGRIVEGTVICTQTEEMQLNITVFVMKTVRGEYKVM
jgi:hypothetical protein